MAFIELRVVNFLYGFPSESLILCEQKSKIAIRSFPRVNRSRRSFFNEQRSKERRERFALGHQTGESSDKLSKTWWKQQIFWANHSFLRAKVRFALKKQFMSLFVTERFALVTLLKRAMREIFSWSLFFKEQRVGIAHSPSLRRAILSERVKSERANSQPC